MNARETPGRPAMLRTTACTFVRNTPPSSPNTLMTTWPSICEMLSSTLSRIGCEKLISTPGMASSAWSMASMIFSLLMPRRHCSGGFKSTKHSTILIGFGSVPSSGRPALEMTAFTSGTLRNALRMAAHWTVASVTEMPGGRFALIQIVPSLSSGKNSVPSLVADTRLTPRPARAIDNTNFRWSSAQARAGS